MSKEAEIESFLRREIAAVLRLDEAAVQTDSSLDELGLHSMAFVELLILIEKQYGVQLMRAGLTRADLGSIRQLAHRIDRAL